MQKMSTITVIIIIILRRNKSHDHGLQDTGISKTKIINYIIMVPNIVYLKYLSIDKELYFLY